MSFITVFYHQANIWMTKLKWHFGLHKEKMTLKKIAIFPNTIMQISDSASIMTDGIMKVLCSRQLHWQWYFSELYAHAERNFLGIFEFLCCQSLILATLSSFIFHVSFFPYILFPLIISCSVTSLSLVNHVCRENI